MLSVQIHLVTMRKGWEDVVEEEELRGGQNDEHRDCFGIRLEEQLDEEEPNESDESDEEKEDEDVVPMDLEDEVNVAIEAVRSSAAAKKKKKTKGANIRKSFSIKQKFRSLEYMEKVEKELGDRRWQSNSPKATLSDIAEHCTGKLHVVAGTLYQ